MMVDEVAARADFAPTRRKMYLSTSDSRKSYGHTLSANLGEIHPACLTSMDACTTFVSDVSAMPETAYGPMLDDQANVEHYYCRPRRNGGLEWSREAKRPNLLGAREKRTG
jgi:hypothetical protein